MNTENLLFMIFSFSEKDLINYSEVNEDSSKTLRVSIDGTKTFVSWVGLTIPNSVQSLTTSEGPYSYNEILEILLTPEWEYPLP